MRGGNDGVASGDEPREESAAEGVTGSGDVHHVARCCGDANDVVRRGDVHSERSAFDHQDAVKAQFGQLPAQEVDVVVSPEVDDFSDAGEERVDAVPYVSG